MDITRRPFGVTARGEAVTAYEITNGAVSAVLLDYGAAVQSLRVPGRGGSVVDVALGYDTIAEYEANDGCFGATVGRVANRIGGARFSLGGREYRLAANDGENHLHGGVRGFDKYVWRAGELDGALAFSRVSPDGEEGYPGTLDVRVSFSITESNELRICYDAVTDAPTPVNLTNHTYFNLNGGGDILSHTLTMDAALYCENGPDCLPTGRLAGVEGTAFDFRSGASMGRALSLADSQTAKFGGFDHNLVLGAGGARLYSPDSGIAMYLRTTLPGVQLYTANSLSRRRGKGGSVMGAHGAVCLETQLFPDGLNHYGFPSPLLRPGERLHTETVYAFRVE